MHQSTASASLPRLIRIDQLAQQTGIPAWRIYTYVRAGMIPHVRLGRAVRFDPAAVAEWIATGGTNYEPPPRK